MGGYSPVSLANNDISSLRFGDILFKKVFTFIIVKYSKRDICMQAINCSLPITEFAYYSLMTYIIQFSDIFKDLFIKYKSLRKRLIFNLLVIVTEI